MDERELSGPRRHGQLYLQAAYRGFVQDIEKEAAEEKRRLDEEKKRQEKREKRRLRRAQRKEELDDERVRSEADRLAALFVEAERQKTSDDAAYITFFNNKALRFTCTSGSCRELFEVALETFESSPALIPRIIEILRNFRRLYDMVVTDQNICLVFRNWMKERNPQNKAFKDRVPSMFRLRK